MGDEQAMVEEPREVVLRDHWHLTVDGEEPECGSFVLLSQRAVYFLGRHFTDVEFSCDAFPSRTHQRCDRCPACRTYDRLEAQVHWLKTMYESFFNDRLSYEMRRCDMYFNEVLPSGTRLRVTLRDSRVDCPDLR